MMKKHFASFLLVIVMVFITIPSVVTEVKASTTANVPQKIVRFRQDRDFRREILEPDTNLNLNESFVTLSVRHYSNNIDDSDYNMDVIFEIFRGSELILTYRPIPTENADWQRHWTHVTLAEYGPGRYYARLIHAHGMSLDSELIFLGEVTEQFGRIIELADGTTTVGVPHTPRIGFHFGWDMVQEFEVATGNFSIDFPEPGGANSFEDIGGAELRFSVSLVDENLEFAANTVAIFELYRNNTSINTLQTRLFPLEDRESNRWLSTESFSLREIGRYYARLVSVGSLNIPNERIFIGEVLEIPEDIEWAKPPITSWTFRLSRTSTYVPEQPLISEPTQPVTEPTATPAIELRLVIGNTTYTQNNISHQMDAAPFIADGRTMVPLALIASALGADVTWNGDTRTVTIVKDGTMLTLTIDVPLPDGMGTPAIVNGRTFVPVAYISQMLDADVRWDGGARAVYIQQ